MTRDQALQILQLPSASEAAAIGQRYADLKVAATAAFTAAPTPGLRAKHQQSIMQLDKAFSVALLPAANLPLTTPAPPERVPDTDPRVEELIRQNPLLSQQVRQIKGQLETPPASPSPAHSIRPESEPLRVSEPLPTPMATASVHFSQPEPKQARRQTALSLRAWAMGVVVSAMLLAGWGLVWKRASDAAKDKAKAKAEAEAAHRRSSPVWATKESPFVNSLGMKFAPVPITGGGPTDGQVVYFSIWETREAGLCCLYKRYETKMGG